LLRVAHVGGVSIRVHGLSLFSVLAVPLGPAVEGVVLGFFVLVLVHEGGHAVVAQLVGAKVTGIDLSPFGGLCFVEGALSPLRRALFAWGGVAAQGLLAIPMLLLPSHLLAEHPLLDGLVFVLVHVSGLAAFVNLVPVEPLDGAQAWRLFPLLGDRLRSRWARWRAGRLPAPAPRQYWN
jgi:Zn-dependent protease